MLRRVLCSILFAGALLALPLGFATSASAATLSAHMSTVHFSFHVPAHALQANSCPTPDSFTTTVAYGSNNGGPGYVPSHVSVTIWQGCDTRWYASAYITPASDGWYFKGNLILGWTSASLGGAQYPGQTLCNVPNKACDTPDQAGLPSGSGYAIYGQFKTYNGVFDFGSTLFSTAPHNF
jgi:hypothetical protein